MTDTIVARKCFIYAIESPSGKRYIGATVQPKHRLISHLKTAEQGAHRSPAFQREFDAVGRSAMKMRILAIVPNDLRQVYEDIYINFYKPELNAVQRSVPFQDKDHIEKVNAARKAKGDCLEKQKKANVASGKVVKRKVRCIETGQVFDSVQSAMAFAGGRQLGSALRCPSCTAYGYHWEYADDNYRPRSRIGEGKNAKILCVETGQIFHGQNQLVEWFASIGVNAKKPTLSQAVTLGCRAYGYYLRRI